MRFLIANNESAQNSMNRSRATRRFRDNFVTRASEQRIQDMSSTKGQSILSRRSILRGATLLAGGAAAVAASIAPTAAQSGKMSQQAAEYQNGPKSGQKCLDCSFFVSPSSCKLVDGTISPVGWCKFYAKKTS